ncbi:hypothetical protein LJC53_05775 [Bacteroidales bacterium OttesenSCG-928-C03]|nr:hypothetical protein [Bacteroidales bacterium OttesenSCG-928-E04]MDL2309074.1 hypothetical protein [Bacteroidales bacterium OttesenSCG-928-C03]
MKDLLKKDFINHYNRHPNLPIKKDEITILYNSVDDISFEIKEETGKKDNIGNEIYGVARYLNPNKLEINIIHYEKFITPLPPRIKNTDNVGKDICDFIVHSANSQYFLLNELTNTAPEFVNEYKNSKGKNEGKFVKALRQLKHSLKILDNVPAIHTYIQKFAIKQCCFFNSYSTVIPDINAIETFNRLDKIGPLTPSKMRNTDIESFGFELCVFPSHCTYLLN